MYKWMNNLQMQLNNSLCRNTQTCTQNIKNIYSLLKGPRTIFMLKVYAIKDLCTQGINNNPVYSICKLYKTCWSKAKIHFCINKSNHFYCHFTTARVLWWVKFLRACSRQCKKKNNLHMDSTYLQTYTDDNVHNTHTYTQYTQCTIRHTYMELLKDNF